MRVKNVCSIRYYTGVSRLSQGKIFTSWIIFWLKFFSSVVEFGKNTAVNSFRYNNLTWMMQDDNVSFWEKMVTIHWAIMKLTCHLWYIVFSLRSGFLKLQFCNLHILCYVTEAYIHALKPWSANLSNEQPIHGGLILKQLKNT